MPLQQTGVQFVNAGLGTALGGMNLYQAALVRTTQTVITSTQKINQTFNQTTTNIDNSSRRFQLFGNVANGFSRNIGTAHIGLLRFNDGLKRLFLGMLGFYALKRVVNEVLDVFQDLFKAMLEGASNTQLLSIRFNNLTAISIQQTQGIKDYSQALQMAQSPAADLLEWVNQMAVKTPFSRDDIANVVGLGMAFDLTAGQSMTLTKAMTDWAAGMGLGNDSLQRMVVNFGQMMRMGKITQRELRDLAIGGLFPVNEALRRIGEKAGLTGEALQKFMSDTATSGVPVQALLTEFVDIAENRFPNAAEQMAKTWAGVTQNIKDFVTTVLGASLLGPTMNKIVKSLSDLLDKALSPSVRAAASVMGETLATNLSKLAQTLQNVLGLVGKLAKAFGITMPSIQQIAAGITAFVNWISDGMNKAVSAVEDWISKSGKSFSEGASKFLKWGFEMVNQFAIGIIKGATTVLTAAMQIISAVLGFFLGPGSPPRVAPNIDKWGTAAMNEWLKGMTQANFDVLNDIQGPLQSALNTLASMGKINKDEVGKIFASVSKQIIKAMDEFNSTGKISEAVFKAIRKAGGEFGKELELLARKQFALLAAMKEVEDAKKAMDAAKKADEAASKKVSDLTDEYRALVEAGASKDVLNAKRAEIKAAMDERDITREGVIEAEKKVETAEAALQPLQDAVKLQEDLVNELIQLAQAQVDAVKDAAGAGAGVGGGFDLEATLKEFDTNMAHIRNEMAIKQIEMRQQIEGMVADMQKKLGEMFAPISEKWEKEVKFSIDKLVESFNKLSGPLDKLLDKISGNKTLSRIAQFLGKLLGIRIALGALWLIIKPVWLLISGLFGGIITKGGSLITTLKTIGTVLGTVLGFIFSTAGALTGIVLFIVAMITNFGGLRDKVSALFASIGNMFGAFGNAWGRVFTRIYNSVMGFINDTALSLATWISGAVTDISNWVATAQTNIGNFFTGLPGTIAGWGKSIVETFITWLASIGRIWNYFWSTDVGQFLIDIWEGATGILVKIVNWGVDLFNKFIKMLDDILAPTGIPSFISKFVKAAEDLVMGLVQGVINKASEFISQVVNTVTEALKKAAEAIGLNSPAKAFIVLGEGMMEGMTVGIKNGTQEAIKAMEGAATGVMAAGAITMNSDLAGRRTVSRPSVAYNRSNSNVRNYNLNVATSKSMGNVARDFAIMETLAG